MPFDKCTSQRYVNGEVRVEEFGESNVLNCGWVNLGFLSQNSLWKFFTFRGYKSIYSRIREECEKSFFYKIRYSGDSLATGMSREIKSQNNWLVRISFFSHESLMRSSNENLFECSHTWILHILSHTILTWFPPKYKVSNC